MKLYFLFLILVVSCGLFIEEERPTEIIIGGEPAKGTAYTFDELISFCTNCHNKFAPPIPLDEDGFKAFGKNRIEIEAGRMPIDNPNFDKQRAILFFAGVNNETGY